MEPLPKYGYPLKITINKNIKCLNFSEENLSLYTCSTAIILAIIVTYSPLVRVGVQISCKILVAGGQNNLVALTPPVLTHMLRRLAWSIKKTLSCWGCYKSGYNCWKDGSWPSFIKHEQVCQPLYLLVFFRCH